MAILVGQTDNANENAVFGRNDSTSPQQPPPGDGLVHGTGVFGFTVSAGAAGVFGANNSAKGAGVQGNGPGPNVKGPDSVGVGGFSDAGFGVLAQSNSGSGVVATSGTGHGLDAFSDNDVAIFAQGATFSGVFNGALVVNKGPKPSDINGSIVINDGNLFLNKGDIFLANAADCAEDFGVSAQGQAEPGTVMVLDDEGKLRESATEYDRRVAGVISGASCYKPGLVLDRHPGQPDRAPLALVGKTFCKVDADYGGIEVGDMLTTSPTPGHAMKARDPLRAFGAVIGKALARCDAGCGLIPILIALQ